MALRNVWKAFKNGDLGQSFKSAKLVHKAKNSSNVTPDWYVVRRGRMCFSSSSSWHHILHISTMTFFLRASHRPSWRMDIQRPFTPSTLSRAYCAAIFEELLFKIKKKKKNALTRSSLISWRWILFAPSSCRPPTFFFFLKFHLFTLVRCCCFVANLVA